MAFIPSLLTMLLEEGDFCQNTLNVNKVLLLDTGFNPEMLEDNNAVVAVIDGKTVLFKVVDLKEITEQIKNS